MFAINYSKVTKKLVKNNRFWRINAIRPKIKAKRGRMRKVTKHSGTVLKNTENSAKSIIINWTSNCSLFIICRFQQQYVLLPRFST